MGRQNVQIVPLDLRGGVITNETGFAIGPRLRLAKNVGWQSFYSTDELRRRSLAFLPHADPTPTVTLASGTHDVATHILGILFNATNRGVVVSEELTTGDFLVHRESNGSLINDTGNAILSSPDPRTAPIADWPSIATPTTYLSHPGLVSPDTYQWTSSAFAIYTPANNPGTAFKGNSALIVHLDRLWLAKQQSGIRTLVWYTDPLDPNTVRPTSFIDIPDYVSSMFRASSSPIDIGAQAHLVFGCFNSVWVLDGDPTQGNAVLRRLKFGIGISDQSCVAPTEFGAVVLATNGQFYLIPEGAQEMVPIGNDNRDIAQVYQAYQLGLARRANASLSWASPYVYYCPDDINACWALDFSRGLPPRWWGPLTSSLNGGFAYGARLFNSGVEDGVPGTGKIRVGLTSIGNDGGKVYTIDLAATAPTSIRECRLRTGYIRVPDHRVKFGRLVLLTTAKATGAEQAIFCSAYTPDGTTKTVQRVPTGVAIPAVDLVVKSVFQFDALAVAGDYFYLEIIWPQTVEPDLQDAWLEFHVEPKAD